MLTVEKLKSVLNYDPETGVFTWKPGARRIGRGRADDPVVAGSTTTATCGKSYVHISIDGKRYYAHRLVVLWFTGSLPKNQVDHIDGNGLNNRVENVREVNSVDNNRNRRRGKRNKSGVVGVQWHVGCRRWIANISVNSKLVHIGYFKRFDDAVAARKSAERRFGYHVNHGSDRPL